MSITGQPKALRISFTCCFAPPSLPAMNMSGVPSGSEGFTMWAAVTMLNALTTRDFGSQPCTISPPEVEKPTTSRGAPPEKSSGFVASMTTLPARRSAPASRAALSVPAHPVARTARSLSFAASAKVATRTLPPMASRALPADSPCGSRVPTMTS